MREHETLVFVHTMHELDMKFKKIMRIWAYLVIGIKKNDEIWHEDFWFLGVLGVERQMIKKKN